jgi:hypothetical protein
MRLEINLIFLDESLNIYGLLIFLLSSNIKFMKYQFLSLFQRNTISKIVMMSFINVAFIKENGS